MYFSCLSFRVSHFFRAQWFLLLVNLHVELFKKHGMRLGFTSGIYTMSVAWASSSLGHHWQTERVGPRSLYDLQSPGAQSSAERKSWVDNWPKCSSSERQVTLTVGFTLTNIPIPMCSVRCLSEKKGCWWVRTQGYFQCGWS